jgi:uncharacterized RDD family membrane protein YckC
VDDDEQDARARLERDYLAGALSADEYMRLRRELHEGVSPSVPHAPSTELRFASWGRRAAAWLLDLLLWIAVVVLTLGLGGELSLFFAVVLLPALYHWLMVGARGQTLGKMALGERVVRAADGGRVGYARAAGRVASFWMLGFFVVPLLIAYLWPLWDRRNQTLYDKMVGTVVVEVR